MIKLKCNCRGPINVYTSDNIAYQLTTLIILSSPPLECPHGYLLMGTGDCGSAPVSGNAHRMLTVYTSDGILSIGY